MCCGAKFGAVGLLLSLLFGRGGCCPQVPPVDVTLQVVPATIVDNGGTATLTATLSAASDEDLDLLLEAQQTPAGSSAGYQLSATQILVPAGQTQGTVTVTALPLPEGVTSLAVVFRVSQITAGQCTWDTDIQADALTILPPGALQVTLAPEYAVTDGAQWNVDGGVWQDNGTTVTGLSAGTHTVNYKAMDGWTEPASEQVTVALGQTTSITGTYTPLPGSLQVTLVQVNPALVEGQGPLLVPQWHIDGGAWHNSGEIVTGLAAGTYAVDYAVVEGWFQPPPEQVVVERGKTTSITRTYTFFP